MRSNICKAAVSMGRGNGCEKRELHHMKHVGPPGVLSVLGKPAGGADLDSLAAAAVHNAAVSASSWPKNQRCRRRRRWRGRCR